MCKQEIDSRVIVNGSWTCEDCGSLVGDVEICVVCEAAEMEEEDYDAEWSQDQLLEAQEREDFCECDESYGYFGCDEY